MNADQPSKILISDDHPLFRAALRQVVTEAYAECECVEASDFETTVSHVQADEGLDMILLDLNMPGMDGFKGLIALRNKAPATPIVIVSANDDTSIIREATTYGAAGFITKSLSKDKMKAAFDRVLGGGVFTPDEADLTDNAQTRNLVQDPDLEDGIRSLTQQQCRVLEILVQGKPNKIIAYELGIAESTVKAHVSAILSKLKVHSRTQAVIRASQILHSLDAASGDRA